MRTDSGRNAARANDGSGALLLIGAVPLFDMPLAQFIEKLAELEAVAEPCFLGATESEVG